MGLPSGELAIEAGYPTNVKWCCNQMLKKWLEMDTTASWGKLFTVIESPAVSYSAPDKGDCTMCVAWLASYSDVFITHAVATYNYENDIFIITQG